MITLDSIIVLNENAFVQRVDNEIVILDTKSEKYFGLDEMATVIWEYLQQVGSLRETHKEVLKVYEVDSKVLERDMCRFIEELLKVGLIQVETV